MISSPEIILELKLNEIFVFGSNTTGRHGKGAAKTALKWGAIYGKGIGLAGRTYAIPTKDHNLDILPLPKIFFYIDEFINITSVHPKKIFLVTKIGCGLAGYTPSQIAPAFRRAMSTNNIRLPKEFIEVIS